MRFTIKLLPLLFVVSLSAQTVPVPLPGTAADTENLQEISCHVQETKQPDGTSQWTPWLRAQKPDGTVWSQQRAPASTQDLATQECQGWVQVASTLRQIHRNTTNHSLQISQAQAEHVKHVQQEKEEHDAILQKIGALDVALKTQSQELHEFERTTNIKVEHLETELAFEIWLKTHPTGNRVEFDLERKAQAPQ